MTKTTKTTKTVEIPLLVTTVHKGVFFGYGDPASLLDKKITIKNARMCVYWSSEMQGIMGLAKQGPSSTCRVGPAVEEILLLDVTAIIKVTPQAAENWEAQPWES